MSSITSGKYFLLAISPTQINKEFSHLEIELGIKNAEPTLIDAPKETEFQCDMLSSTQHIDSYSQPHSSISDNEISNNYPIDAISIVDDMHGGMPSYGWTASDVNSGVMHVFDHTCLLGAAPRWRAQPWKMIARGRARLIRPAARRAGIPATAPTCRA
ncbi:hypothetical protein [Massilia oculi]|uniref:hypothetical protein n=1 Tax=Massilia oculi TaxID=945844 RepID=UPI001AB00048|nr:hypothetical protein [Massilia oculi]